MPEPLTVRRKRLLYQSRYRGSLESDLFFGRFATTWLDKLDQSQLARYEALLGESDHDLFAWLSGRQPVPSEHDHDVFAMLQAFSPARATPTA
jgi:antitoxin CptB